MVLLLISDSQQWAAIGWVFVALCAIVTWFICDYIRTTKNDIKASFQILGDVVTKYAVQQNDLMRQGKQINRLWTENEHREGETEALDKRVTKTEIKLGIAS